MINIPTELLRTLVAVVELRSFTRAAHSLGVTQPAVSAQIKRLQYVLGAEILDKSAPGVSLTAVGEAVVEHARRLLAINDQILGIAAPLRDGQVLRIATLGDFVAIPLARAVARLREERPDLHVAFETGIADKALRDLRESGLDLVFGLSVTAPAEGAYRSWPEPLVWAGGPTLRLDRDAVVPVISYGEDCAFHRIAMKALGDAGRASTTSVTGASIAGLVAAAAAGLGVMVMPKSRLADFPTLSLLNGAGLPALPDVFCTIHVRDGSGRDMREALADAIVAMWNAPTENWRSPCAAGLVSRAAVGA
jgi:DNA-binding transcriptional LysR family regulator